MKNIFTTLLAGTALTMTSAFAQVVFVDFGGNYTSTGPGLRGSSDAAWTGGTTPTVPFSSSSTLSPSSNWSGNSSVFYGGVTSGVTATTARFATTVNQTDPTADRVRVGLTVGAGQSISSVAGLIYWDQVDFLNGGSSTTISLDSTSSISLNLNSTTNFRGRWVIRNGTQFYVSNGTANFSNTSGTVSLSGATLMSTNWDQYNPASSLTWTSGTGTIASSALTNITGVGFYYVMGANTGVGDADFNVTFDDFSFTGTAIPEPTTWALLAGGLTTLLIFRRRKA